MNKVEKIKESLETKFKLTFMDELHLLISFLIAFAIRGDVIENAFAVIPIVSIFVLKEVYDCSNDNATGFSKKDLGLDAIGGIIGYVLALIF